MTDDLSRLDEVVNREASARPRKAQDPVASPEPSDPQGPPEWARAFIALTERMLVRLMAIEDGVHDLRAELRSVEERVLADLHPMLVRRHDDVVRIQGTLTVIGSDLEQLRGELKESVAFQSSAIDEVRLVRYGLAEFVAVAKRLANDRAAAQEAAPTTSEERGARPHRGATVLEHPAARFNTARPPDADLPFFSETDSAPSHERSGSHASGASAEGEGGISDAAHHAHAPRDPSSTSQPFQRPPESADDVAGAARERDEPLRRPTGDHVEADGVHAREQRLPR